MTAFKIPHFPNLPYFFFLATLSQMKTLNLKIVVWQEDKYYVARCLNTNVSSFGKNKKEALFNINEALELYFEDNKEPNIIDIKEPELVQSSLSYA